MGIIAAYVIIAIMDIIMEVATPVTHSPTPSVSSHDSFRAVLTLAPNIASPMSAINDNRYSILVPLVMVMMCAFTLSLSNIWFRHIISIMNENECVYDKRG